MHKLIITAILAIVLSACATAQPLPKPPLVVRVIAGETEVEQTVNHPCYGKWNFCEQAMKESERTLPYHNQHPFTLEEGENIPGE